MSTPRKPPSASRAMCCVRIGFQEFLLPAEKGMKLLELMQNAVECDHSFDHGEEYYQVRGTPRLELAMVKPNLIRMPVDESRPVKPSRLLLEQSR